MNGVFIPTGFDSIGQVDNYLHDLGLHIWVMDGIYTIIDKEAPGWDYVFSPDLAGEDKVIEWMNENSELIHALKKYPKLRQAYIQLLKKGSE